MDFCSAAEPESIVPSGKLNQFQYEKRKHPRYSLWTIKVAQLFPEFFFD
jgi:hypothetical protein